NSIASVIANEFTEATYDLYLSALVELGLVLLLVSVVVNALARLLIRQVSLNRSGPPPRNRRLAFWKRKGLGPSPTPTLSALTPGLPSSPVPRRFPISTKKVRWVNRLMTGILCLCLVVTVGPLFLILGHLVYVGMGALNWEYFVNLPAPVGEKGGGMANALYGSFLLVGLATLFAVPVGLLAAVYLAEYGSDRLAPAVRFIGELLSGVPSIVIGIFAYNLVVRPMGHFSGWAGAFALGVMMIPIVMRASEEAVKMV